MTSRETAPLLQVRALSKAFGTTIACDAIDMSIEKGEIHALLGENGAGKSTLVKMLFGSLQPDSGSIVWNGDPTVVASPSAARRMGVGMVFQHFSLFEPLTVAENIALGSVQKIPLRAIAEEAEAISRRYGLPIDPAALIGDLAAGQRQRVEIVRALMQDPMLLILDEPTSVLTPSEADALFETLRRMRGEGRSVLYISHRLEEVQRLCDRATVLRRGAVVATCDPHTETAASLATMMVGSAVSAVEHREFHPGPPVLEISGLSASRETPFAVALDEIELTVREGEIVCVAGVAGNGQSELFEVLSGERVLENGGSIRIASEEVAPKGISERRRLSAAFVPEERNGHGALARMSLAENVLLSRHASDPDTLLWGGPLHGTRANGQSEIAERVIASMDVRASGPKAPAGSLSGGNLQKYVVGRELDRAPRLLVIDQPSWGVDAGAAAALRQATIDLAAEGGAVLAISQDLDEIFEIATHVCVMDAGRLSPKTPIADVTRESIGLLMGGSGREAA